MNTENLEFLYHCTLEENLESIMKYGLLFKNTPDVKLKRNFPEMDSGLYLSYDKKVASDFLIESCKKLIMFKIDKQILHENLCSKDPHEPAESAVSILYKGNINPKYLIKTSLYSECESLYRELYDTN